MEIAKSNFRVQHGLLNNGSRSALKKVKVRNFEGRGLTPSGQVGNMKKIQKLKAGLIIS
jgi:hypothetical protein